MSFLSEDVKALSWAGLFGGGEWVPVSGDRPVGEDIDFSRVAALSKALPEAAVKLHEGVVAGRVPSFRELVEVAATLVPMTGELLRLQAGHEGNKGMFLGAKTATDSSAFTSGADQEVKDAGDISEFMSSIASGSAYFAVRDVKGEAEPQVELLALQQLLESSKRVVVIERETGKQRELSLSNDDDFKWLVDNAGFNPFTSGYDVMARAAGSVDSPPRCHVMGSFMPLPFDRKQWAEHKLWGEFSPRVIAMNVSHRTGGHLSVLMAFRWSGVKSDPIEGRLVGVKHETVDVHRDPYESRFQFDPFGARPGSNHHYKIIEGDGEVDEFFNAGDVSVTQMQQTGRMLKALGELLEKRGEDGLGWQEFNEEGEARDMAVGDDPFEGLILSGGRAVKA